MIYEIRQSWNKERQLDAIMGISYPTVKPDYDNVAKLVGDSLNGILWMDDSQIVQATLEKRYGLVPGMRLEVEFLD
jgi:Holliday junction resolvase RusA-like endonuclease